jgi:hypothetical protein
MATVPQGLEGVMNSSSETVAFWDDDSKTIPKRRFRRRVGLCRPLSGARSRRRSTAQPRAARGLQRAEVDRENRLLEWRYMPHDLPTQGKPSTSRRGGGSQRATSKRWSTICAYSCAFRRAGRPSRRQRYSTLALYAPPRRVALGAATTEQSARRARRYTRQWILSGAPARLVRYSGQ